MVTQIWLKEVWVKDVLDQWIQGEFIVWVGKEHEYHVLLGAAL